MSVSNSKLLDEAVNELTINYWTKTSYHIELKNQSLDLNYVKVLQSDVR